MRLSIQLPGTGERGSDILIEEGAMERALGEMEVLLGGRRPFWIWDERVAALWLDRARELEWPVRSDEGMIRFRFSEANKRLAAIELLARELMRAGADRGGALVAVGGGVTGDMVGFLAAVFMRGIPHFQIPTTLLAQVDSSIGGKTGVDLPEGKNLIGAFHQPRGVWIDPRFLSSLPPEEMRQGMAEVIKTAMIGDEVLWRYVESHSESLRKREPEALARIISGCCLFKAHVVEADEKESGRRRVLNFGHTVGHAIEKVSGYEIPHGDAVAMGMMAATTLAVSWGRFPPADLARLEKLCQFWELPTRLPRALSPERVLDALGADKKRVSGALHFVLPVRIGETVEVIDPDLKDLRKVLESLAG
ncbi:MAG: 3-dehydroquinate synthase [Syntrophobacteraceae bacterium]|jgi:3-dehydroquinate synthase|nr:3-dehydroquinate synthase [Syntrophobacteraceae bacterium]